MKKRFLLVVTTLVFALALGGLAACGGSAGSSSDGGGPSDEELITQDVESTLSSMLDQDTIATAFRSVEGVSDLEGLGFDVDAVSEAIASSLKFEVENVTVDGDAATATVKMSYPDFESDEMAAALQEKLESLDVADMTSTADIVKAYQDAMVEVLTDSSLPQASDQTEVDYVRDGDGWKMKDEDAIAEEINELAETAGSAASE